MFTWKKNDNVIPWPLPTNQTGVFKEMEDEKSSLDKKKWIELLHQSDSLVDWRSVEAQTAQNKYLKYQNEYQYKTDDIISIGEGQLVGHWEERGSNNQSGSITQIDFDQSSNLIYALSDGGTLWKSRTDGINWTLIEDQIRLDNRFLKFIQKASTKRIIAAINGVPHFKDGNSPWIASDISAQVQGAELSNLRITENGKNLFFLADEGPLKNIRLYYSDDWGESFRIAYQFGTSDLNNLAMDASSDSDLIIIEQRTSSTSRIYTWNKSDSELVIFNNSSQISFGSAKANVQISYINELPYLFAYDSENRFLRSANFGQSWTMLSNLPITPWTDGIIISDNNPQRILIGAVEAYLSRNGGLSWEKVNAWTEYYSNPSVNLHADMMDFNASAINGTHLICVAHHGGISISYDQGENFSNIALSNLNVGQYYDVRNYPVNPYYIFAGSQDQGLQRTLDFEEGTANFTQMFSGDYGHLSFTNNGKSLWSVFPGGLVFYYEDPLNFNIPINSYNLQSQQESVWLPQIIRSPYHHNGILMAGGNFKGGSGSHILELNIGDFGNLSVNQFPFNFANSGGELSGLAYNHFNNNEFYAITTNGKFYKSTNKCQSFTIKETGLTNAQYLYGTEIYCSKRNPNELYIVGSGYSNASIYQSLDGGESFSPLQYNLPQTTIFDIDMDRDEEFIFAATEAGPYVYSKKFNQWYDMSQGKAPNQRYWSVEYSDVFQNVRFGTYGRGIWDFNISHLSDIEENLTEVDINVYPNPFSKFIEYTSSEKIKWIKVIDQLGRPIMQIDASNRKTDKIDLSDFQNGIYYIIFESDNYRSIKKIVKS